MEHSPTHLKVINGVQEQENRVSPSSKRKRIALAFVVAAVLVGLVNWLVATSDGSSPGMAAQASAPVKSAPVSAATGSSTEAEYYPGKFRNQAQRSEPEEHIPAF